MDIVPVFDSKFPVLDITPPPAVDFEARLIIWSCEGIPAGDEFTKQSDLFVKAQLGNSGGWKSTDTHFLAKKGKGSFNYRIKFPLKLKDRGRVGEGGSVLKLQCWDADLFSSSDCLCETSIDISDALAGAWILKDAGLTYTHYGDGKKQVARELSRRQRQRNEAEAVREEAGEQDSLLKHQKQTKEMKSKKKSSRIHLALF